MYLMVELISWLDQGAQGLSREKSGSAKDGSPVSPQVSIPLLNHSLLRNVSSDIFALEKVSSGHGYGLHQFQTHEEGLHWGNYTLFICINIRSFVQMLALLWNSTALSTILFLVLDLPRPSLPSPRSWVRTELQNRMPASPRGACLQRLLARQGL